MPLSDKPHPWRFYLSPGEAWDAMYRDCEGATESIDLEQYIFENDPLGRKFIRLFIQKAKQGVKIRILCDEFGSRDFYNSPLVTTLRQNGGTFRFYNTITILSLLTFRHWFPRTHCKMLVADSVAYIGGVCWAQRMKDWRDTQIRVTGLVVLQIKKAIENDVSGRRRPKRSYTAPSSGFQYIQSEPRLFRHLIYHALLKAINEAKDVLYLSTAFFVPTRRLRRALRAAAHRGVKVILLVPERSDFRIVDWVCLSYAVRLLKAGVRIFRYQPTVLHNKTAVVDGAWATVGSSNMDPLSFFHNRESNLIVTDKDAIAEMKKDFLNDLQQSKELTREALRQIPLWKRAMVHVARLFRSFL